jgi:DNA modification methylase
MFSVKGELVLDPFLVSGTTTKIAMQNERNSIGYETDPNLLPIITKKISNCAPNMAIDVKIIKR